MKPITFLKQYNLYFTILFMIVIWSITAIDQVYLLDLYQYGIFPRTLHGLRGILFSPLLHENWQHLTANSMALIVVIPIVFYSYRGVALTIFGLLYLMSGVWVWSFARESYHIGASGICIGLTSFIFFSGLIRRNMQLMAWSCLMLFLYGSVVWQIFPSILLPPTVSWEAHLSGFVAGLILSIIYKKVGPQREEYHWDNEDDETDLPEGELHYWEIDLTNEEKEKTTESNQNTIQ